MKYKYNGDPYDDAFTAARQANETGTTVKMNGITYHPNPPKDIWQTVGMVFCIILGVGITIFMCAGFFVMMRILQSSQV